MMSLFRTNPGVQSGQAATECVLLCSFILIPLFLVVPLIGKYIDIKHAAIAQSRYEVWEYTAWFDELSPDDSGSSITTPHAGAKNLRPTRTRPLPQTRIDGFHYFFTDSTSPSYSQGTEDRLNPLWVDHRGISLFHDSPADTSPSPLGEGKTPDPTSGFIDGLLTGINDVTAIYGDLLHAVGVDADFDVLNTKGYFTSQFSLKLKSIGEIFPEQGQTAQPLQMYSQSSVLARGWDASSTDKAKEEARGLVISAILEPVSDLFNSLINPLQDIVGKVNHMIGHFLPIHIDMELPHMPIFGYMDEDLALPEEHFKNSKQKLRHKSGLYYYAGEQTE